MNAFHHPAPTLLKRPPVRLVETWIYLLRHSEREASQHAHALLKRHFPSMRELNEFVKAHHIKV
jgi:hypothetical protein